MHIFQIKYKILNTKHLMNSTFYEFIIPCSILSGSNIQQQMTNDPGEIVLHGVEI
jgi:hypothetical protein